MCFVLNIEAPAEARPFLEALSREASFASLRLEVQPPPRWFRLQAGPVRATLSEHHGCACSLLTDHAHWKDPCWDMRPEVLEPLARALEAVGAAVPQGFTFAPLWVSGRATEQRTVTPAELGALARQGRLGTATAYRVIAPSTGSGEFSLAVS